MAFLCALIIAFAIHLLFINQLTLKTSLREKPPELMEVTLLTVLSPVKPKKNNVIAIEDQREDRLNITPEKQHNEVSRPQVVVRAQKSSTMVHGSTVMPLKDVEQQNTTVKPEAKIEKTKIEKKTVVEKKAVPEKVMNEKTTDEKAQKPHLSPELLQQQISQLGSAVREQQLNNTNQRIKFIDAINASKYVAAQYLHDWEAKVERTGNLNYPQMAGQKNFSGTLTMDVGIKLDGTIYSIRINQSSGNSALDEAAKKIVRMSAPFAPLPIELQKELDVLVITRVWRFSDYSGLIAQ